MAETAGLWLGNSMCTLPATAPRRGGGGGHEEISLARKVRFIDPRLRRAIEAPEHTNLLKVSREDNKLSLSFCNSTVLCEFIPETLLINSHYHL